MSGGILEFDRINKRYPDGTHAVKDFSLTVSRGELIVLIGPSGCGKTTTLRMINRLIEPSSGRIFVDGQDYLTMNPVQLRRRLGYVIQRIGLMPHLTIGENITLVLRLNGVKPPQRRERAAQLLAMVGLDPGQYLDRYPRELSGGQQQRIGVLRALAHDPDIILMDEPFGALDPLMREQLQDELKRLQQSVEKTIIFVTHDMDEALAMADRIVLMRDGSIVQVASPEGMLREPANEFVANFIGRSRVLRQASEVTVGEIMISRPVSAPPDFGLARGLELMRRRRVSALLVVDPGQNRLLGVVNQRLIEQGLNDQGTTTLGQIAEPPSCVLRPDDTTLAAMHQFIAGRDVDVLPVVTDEETLAGIVTRSTLVGLLDTALHASAVAEAGDNPAGSLGEEVSP